MKPPAFQFYADDNGFNIGAPSSGDTPSAFLNARRFMIDTMALGNAESGKVIQEICHLLRSRDFDALKQFTFISRVIRGAAKRPHIPTDVRRRVLALGKCAICESPDSLEVDHVIPFSKGGAHAEHNFQCLCASCNRKKGAAL